MLHRYVRIQTRIGSSWHYLRFRRDLVPFSSPFLLKFVENASDVEEVYTHAKLKRWEV